MPQERIEVIFVAKGIRTVQRQLTGIGDQAQKAGARTQKMGDSIDRGASRGARSLRRTQDEMRRTGNEATRMSGRVTSAMAAFTVPTAAAASLRNMQRGLRGLAGAVSGFYAGRYLAQAFDDFTRIQNALKGFGVGAGSIDRVTDALTDLANEARVSSVETATLFGRLRLATRDLGLSEKEVLGLTGTLNKALRLSGSSGLEASQSVRQLSQAFNKGKLDGDEFRSVLENAPILTKLLTKELKISKGELYDWAAAGKITTKILSKAIKEGSADIDAAFKKLRPTIGDAFTNLFNNIRRFVGTTPEAGSAVSVLTDAITFLGENLNVVLGILEAYAAIFVAGKVIGLFQGMAKGAKALSAALKGLAASQALVGGASVLEGAGAAAAAGATALPGAAVGSIVSTSAASAAAEGATALPLTAIVTDSKKVQSIWKKIGGFIVAPFKSVASIIVRIVSSAARLLRIFNPLYVIFAAMAGQVGKGIVDSLKKATDTTSTWEAVVTTISALWDTVSTSIGGVADLLMTKISSVLKAILYLIDVAFAEALGMATTLGMLIEEPSAILNTKRLGEIQDSGRKASKAYMDAVKAGTDGFGNRLQGVGADWIGNPLGKMIAPALAKKDYDKAVAPLYQTLGELEDRVAEMKIGERLAAGLGVTAEQLKELSNIGADASISDFTPLAKKAIADASAEGRDVSAILEAAQSLREYTTALQEIKNAFPATADEALKAVDRFQDFGDKPTDITELNSVRDAAVALNGYLKQTLESFNGLEAAIRIAEGSEGIEGVERALEEVKNKINVEAEKLPPPIAQAAREAADVMITETKGVLTSGAVEIAQAVRSAFLGALAPGLGSIAGQLTAPGQTGPGGIGTSTQLNLPETSTQIKQNTDKVRELNNVLAETQQRLNDYANRAPGAFQQAGNSAKNTANDIQQFFEGAFGSLEDALVGFVTTGKLDFKSLINSIIADLARMVIRMLIIKPLMGFFGGIFGFSSGGIVPGYKNGGVIPGYAPGGIVTGFGGARSDNQLAALSPGEMVINAASTRSNRGSLEYINKTGKMPPTRDGGSTVFAPSIVINQQGNDPEVTAQMVDAAVKRSWTELAVKSQRKGGVFDRRGG